MTESWEERKAGGRNGSSEGQLPRTGLWFVCVLGRGVHVESSGSVWPAPCLTPRDRPHKVLRSFRSGVGCFLSKDRERKQRGWGRRKRCKEC